MSLSVVLATLLGAALPDNVSPVPVPADAVTWAVRDLETIPLDARIHQRYIWDHMADINSHAAITFVLNSTVSRASIIVEPTLVPNTKNQLFRIDLRNYGPNAKDYATIHTVWESQDLLEPFFHSITFVNKVELVSQKVRISVPPYVADDGKTYDYKYEIQQVPKLTPVAQAATFSPHLALPTHIQPIENSVEKLAAYTASNVPIVRFDQFLVRALTTLNGGLYYKWIGADKQKVQGKSDQVRFLETYGASQELSESLRADNRAALFRSSVALRKPRQVDLFFGVGVKPSQGIPLVTVTHDISIGSVDPEQHPIRNLVDFKDDAREIIVVRSNGLLDYALFNSAGVLQDDAPPDIVKDSTVPSDHASQLQPAISCIRCHGPHTGYQPIRNDVRHMMEWRDNKGLRLAILGDLGDPSKDPVDILDQLYGRYKARPELMLDLARTQYAATVASFSRAKVEELTEYLSARFGAYVYDPVTAQTACYELGFAVAEEDAVELYNTIVPMLPTNAQGFSPEDPIVAALRTGTKDYPVSISRFEWDQIYSDVMLRSNAWRVQALAQEN